MICAAYVHKGKTCPKRVFADTFEEVSFDSASNYGARSPSLTDWDVCPRKNVKGTVWLPTKGIL
eukprot:1146942-Pelagomonas_calceolata.AAC.1